MAVALGTLTVAVPPVKVVVWLLPPLRVYVTVAPLVPLKVNVAVLLAQTGLLLAEIEAVGKLFTVTVEVPVRFWLQLPSFTDTSVKF